jgi:hypothetical protein
MNRKLLNNEIICTVLRIHQRYFSSDKYSVEIFNTYMQEVNLKFYNFQFILLNVSVSGPLYKQEISASRFVELCPGVVVSEKSLYFTHTCHLLKTSLTTFFSRHSQFTSDILAASLSRTKLTKVC